MQMQTKTVQKVLDDLGLTPEEEIYYADLIEECKSREAALNKIAGENDKNQRIPKIGSPEFDVTMEHFLTLMGALKEGKYLLNGR